MKRYYQDRQKPLLITFLFIVISINWFQFSRILITSYQEQIISDIIYSILGGSLLYYLIRRYNNKLKSRIKDLIDRESELKELVDEKDALLSEIHHRVKNNLATISGLIDLQIMDENAPETRHLLLKTQHRIKSIALVHEKLYQDYLFSEIRLDTYLEDLTKNIDDIFTNRGLPVYMNENISCLLDIEPILIDMNKAVPFGLLATELITNAYKHAFPNNQKGHIHITLKKQNDDIYYFKVKDNGVGIVDDSLLDQPRTTGFQLIQTLSNQLQAKWQVDLKNGFGVTFKFDFKHFRKPNRTETQNQLKLL